MGLECVTLEGTTRDKFDAFTKALNWPLAPEPPEKPGSAPTKTAMIPVYGENSVAVRVPGSFLRGQTLLLSALNGDKR